MFLGSSVLPGDIAPKHRMAVSSGGMVREGTQTARHSPPQGRSPAGRLDREKPTRPQPYTKNCRRLNRLFKGRTYKLLAQSQVFILKTYIQMT